MRLKNWFKAGLLSLMLAGCASPNANNCTSLEQKLQENNPPKVVETGRLEYNQGSLVSYEFVRCSSVVFDYGNSAFMAHAVPYPEKELRYGDETFVTTTGVIDSLVKASEKQGFNPKNAKVYVNAGTEEALKKITKELQSKNIKLTEGKLRFDKNYDPQYKDAKTILYNPSRNKMSTFDEGTFPDYRPKVDPSKWDMP